MADRDAEEYVSPRNLATGRKRAFSDEEAIYIRSLWYTGKSIKDLAKTCDCNYKTMYNVVHHKGAYKAKTLKLNGKNYEHK